MNTANRIPLGKFPKSGFQSIPHVTFHEAHSYPYAVRYPYVCTHAIYSSTTKENTVSALSFNAPGEREKSLWLIKKENDPAHSQMVYRPF